MAVYLSSLAINRLIPPGDSNDKYYLPETGAKVDKRQGQGCEGEDRFYCSHRVQVVHHQVPHQENLPHLISRTLVSLLQQIGIILYINVL